MGHAVHCLPSSGPFSSTFPSLHSCGSRLKLKKKYQLAWWILLWCLTLSIPSVGPSTSCLYCSLSSMDKSPWPPGTLSWIHYHFMGSASPTAHLIKDSVGSSLCLLNTSLHEGHSYLTGSPLIFNHMKIKLVDSVLEHKRISAAWERKATKNLGKHPGDLYHLLAALLCWIFSPPYLPGLPLGRPSPFDFFHLARLSKLPHKTSNIHCV